MLFTICLCFIIFSYYIYNSSSDPLDRLLNYSFYNCILHLISFINTNHYMVFLYTSYNLRINVVSFFNISANLNYLSHQFYSTSPTQFFHSFYLLELSSLVKAFFVGTTICHTTDILNCHLCYVHWSKPPSFHSL